MMGQICLLYRSDLVRLMGVAEDDMDLYYVVERPGYPATTGWASAVGHIDPLKASLPDEVYHGIERHFSFNGSEPKPAVILKGRPDTLVSTEWHDCVCKQCAAPYSKDETHPGKSRPTCLCQDLCRFCGLMRVDAVLGEVSSVMSGFLCPECDKDYEPTVGTTEDDGCLGVTEMAPTVLGTLTERLAALTSAQCAYLSIGMMRDIIRMPASDDDIMIAATALCKPGSASRILMRCATFTDKYGDDFDVEAEDLIEVEASGQIVHPVSGDVFFVKDVCLSVYFSKI